jgi:hypothetical protein
MNPLMVRVMRNEMRIRTWLGTVAQYAEKVAQGIRQERGEGVHRGRVALSACPCRRAEDCDR